MYVYERFLEQGNIEAAIRKGFMEFDREMALSEEMREDLAGTTAVCVIIKDQKLFCVSEFESIGLTSIEHIAMLIFMSRF
jgi:serine/threonine protein phosphatase PrpC